MRRDSHTPVLALGIDSAEPTLVRALIDRGELPALAGLLERGSWALVDSGAEIGSGAVWPTFFTGTDPSEHQISQGWVWRPDAMACGGHDEGRLIPFWKPFLDAGGSVGVLDVPFAPPLPAGEEGFQVSEWGPHEVVQGVPRVRPAAAEAIVSRAGRHPFYEVPYGPGYAEDRNGRTRLAAACVAGAGLRGELAARLISATRPPLSIIVFTEVHHTTHFLWHTVEPEHEMYADRGLDGSERPSLVEVYREVDRQLERIVDAAGPEAAVMAFSLHGMKPTGGIPTFPEPLLVQLGFSVPAAWGGMSWRARARAALGAAKRRVPKELKKLYHRTVGFDLRFRLAQPTIMPPHDWSRTTAFALPTDQRGFIRINLAGREAEGIVPERDYWSACDRVEEALRGLTLAGGEPLVEAVVRPAERSGAPPQQLPDLVVDWHDAAVAGPVRIETEAGQLEADPIRTDMTGQHARRGFCILDERLAEDTVGERLAGVDLHRILLAGVGAAAT